MAESAFTWAARIQRASAALLGQLRLIRGLEAAEIDGCVWVRGRKLSGEQEEAVRRVPWEARYELKDRQLRRAGHLLPERPLPAVTWAGIAQFLQAGAPAVASPSGLAPKSARIELRPVTQAREPSLLETSAQEWLRWVEHAPEIRLAKLSFAHDRANAGHVLVRGTPLPPLSGRRFTEEDGVAVPAGMRWQPDVSAGTLRSALGTEKHELAILAPDGAWTRVPRSAWIAAARSAVRLTLA